MGSVSEWLGSGAAAAAEEDRRLLRDVICGSVGIEDLDRPLAEIGAIVGGRDRDVGHRFLLLGAGAGPLLSALPESRVHSSPLAAGAGVLLGPGGLVPGRGSWQAEELEPIALGDRGEPRHVRVC